MHIYFSGAGGVGIGPLAMLALDSGFKVSGSDLKHSEVSEQLNSRGAKIYIGQDGSQIESLNKAQPIDWFVYSSALPKNHPELLFAKNNKIKTSKRDEFLNFLLDQNNLRLIAVSGTHGKTTTTAMIIWLFKQLNIPVSYSVGASLSFGPSAQYHAGSEYFIYECDEFDRNFLHFKPYLSVITNIDYDHSDTYVNKTEYNEAFLQFLSQSKRAIIWQDDADQLKQNDLPEVTILSEADPGINQVKLAGQHMRQNGWLAINAFHKLMPKTDEAKLNKLMANFPGTGRRFEKLADNLYSDYAHHPTEIAATIKMAKEINPNVIVVYQPHQNIRQHEILKEGGYKDSFNGAKKVYWLPTYLSREYQKLDTLSQADLIKTLDDPNLAEPIKMDDNLWQKIQAHQRNDDLVLCMSAGDLDYWIRENLKNV